jgi:5-methylcytosine-specific restriction endonuclease McrA
VERPRRQRGRVVSDAGRPGTIDAATLLRLVEDSGHSPPVIEEAVRLLRRGLAAIDASDPALVEVLRAHLLSVGTPTDVTKYFSLELLERTSAARAEEVSVELVELLARSPLLPDRGYHVERAVLRTLGERKVARALPALALLAGRCVAPLSRTAARAVVAIIKNKNREAIAARLSEADLPEASGPRELAASVGRALGDGMPRSTRGSDPHKRRGSRVSDASTTAAHPRSASLPREDSDRFLRPEPRKAKQARLRAALRTAGRDPARCGNCELAGKMTIVHVVPLARGGTDRAGNLVPLCADCKRKLPRRVRDAERAPLPAQTDAPQMSLFG